MHWRGVGGSFAEAPHLSDFKGRRFPTDVILVCARWYCKYGINYRDLEGMMTERVVVVDHTTLFRWVQRYAPLIEKRIRWYQRYTDASWRVDETYVKVAGQWAYLYRAIDKNGEIIDFMLSPRRTLNRSLSSLNSIVRDKTHSSKFGVATSGVTHQKSTRRLLAQVGKRMMWLKWLHGLCCTRTPRKVTNALEHEVRDGTERCMA